jgi:RNA polymerase sigma-70 factor (ECF subfamily)
MDADESFTRALTDCQGFIRAVVRRFAAERSSVDDLVQEASLQAWRNRASFRPGSSFQVWLFVVAKHAAIGYRRCRRGRQHHHSSLDGVNASAPECRTEVLTAEKLERMVRAGDVLDDTQRRWFLGLPLASRRIILHAAAEGAKYTELAAYFAMPIGTVRSQIHRMRASARTP